MASQYNPRVSRTNRYPARVLRRSTSEHSRRSLTPNRLSSDQIEGRPRQNSPVPVVGHRNHENVNKSKGPDKCPGLCKSDRSVTPGCKADDFIRPLRAALPEAPGPSRPFRSSSSVMRSTRNLGVVQRPTLAPADPIKGTVSGSRFVDLDEFLQRMHQFFPQIPRAKWLKSAISRSEQRDSYRLSRSTVS